VSLAFANTLFGFWIAEVAVLVALAIWLGRRRPSNKPERRRAGTRPAGKASKQSKRAR
jgi:hypothetical protein